MKFELTLCRRTLWAALLAAISAEAQTGGRTTLRVVTTDGQPVPYAWVSIDGGNAVVADSAGFAHIGTRSRDTVSVFVRRIGYEPLNVKAIRATHESEFVVELRRLPGLLDTVRVTTTNATPLVNTGFYDRMERTRRGAFTAEFITPEELDARNAVYLSQMFQGRRTTTVGYVSSLGARTQTVLLGRARCPMTILIDGQRQIGTLQEDAAPEVPTSVRPAGSASWTFQAQKGLRLSLDDIVDVHAVMGIEIYPSTANAPVDLIPIGGRGSCGFVAIWTGARR